MSLYSRLAARADVTPAPVEEPAPVPTLAPDEGLYTFTADFYSLYGIVRARTTGPEARLSDWLNGALPSLDIVPCTFTDCRTGLTGDLDGDFGHITKDRLLFVIPVAEPERPRGQISRAWRPTVRRKCWASVGPYTLQGTLHAEADRDVRFASRLLDHQFMPLTDVTLTHPDGHMQPCGTIIVQRMQLDFLTVCDDAM